METFTLRVDMAHTGSAPGWDLPVPLGWEVMHDIPKSGIPPKTRKEYHELLDHWLDRVQDTPDQYGSRIPCFFRIEYRGDSQDWQTTQEQLAAETKRSVRARLAQILKRG